MSRKLLSIMRLSRKIASNFASPSLDFTLTCVAGRRPKLSDVFGFKSGCVVSLCAAWYRLAAERFFYGSVARSTFAKATVDKRTRRGKGKNVSSGTHALPNIPGCAKGTKKGPKRGRTFGLFRFLLAGRENRTVRD